MKYSICTTVYNTAPRVQASLDSILKYINPEEFEIVVVDSKSTDGTQEILKEYAKRYPNFKVIEKKCKRGRGRQIAFENSKGNLIIQVDLDTIYLPVWIRLLREYEKLPNHNNFALQARYLGFYPRHLLEKVGGWRNLQYAEDFDLWRRLIEINAFRWTRIVVGYNWRDTDPEKRQSKNNIERLWRTFIREKDRMFVRGEFNLRDHLRIIKLWDPPTTKFRYYFFWVPMISIAYFAAILQGRRSRDLEQTCREWLSCEMDFEGIDAKRYTDILGWVAYRKILPPNFPCYSEKDEEEYEFV